MGFTKKTGGAPSNEVSEGAIEGVICQFLSCYRDGMLYKVAPGGFYNGKRFVRHRNKYIRNGHPDIVFHHSGHCFYFEVKRVSEYKYLMKYYAKIKVGVGLNKRQKHLHEQVLFIEDLRRVGHMAEFVCDVEMVKKVVDKKLRGM